MCFLPRKSVEKEEVLYAYKYTLFKNRYSNLSALGSSNLNQIYMNYMKLQQRNESSMKHRVKEFIQYESESAFSKATLLSPSVVFMLQVQTEGSSRPIREDDSSQPSTQLIK